MSKAAAGDLTGEDDESSADSPASEASTVSGAGEGAGTGIISPGGKG